MLKIGVFGAGHLGKIHIKLLLTLKEHFEVVGFFDPNDDNAQVATSELGITRFTSESDLINAVDAIDIVTPTLSHFTIAKMALQKCKHVFIEKPITETIKEAKTLLKIAEEAQVKVQIGHVERFNPAFTVAEPYLDKPMFIETHRLAHFNPRGTDVPVVLDLMIHDIDIILSVIKARVKRISASGVSVLSDTPDIANARIEFDNGAVANLTASRISLKNMRKSRFFQKDAYISVDFLEKKAEIVQMENVIGEPDPFDFVIELGEGKPSKKIIIEKPEMGEINAIQEELRTFALAIKNDTTPIVSIEDGALALEVATEIIKKISPMSIA